MNAYVYQASWFCEPCALKVRAKVAPHGDSDQYPQGPYGDGGGEADSPQHCDNCNEFLANPLTSDGYEYVQETVADNRANGRADSIACTLWAPFYEVK